MVEAAQPIIQITTPSRTFKGHEDSVVAAAVFPDGHRMVTGSHDKTLCLWDLEKGVVLKKMEGHRDIVKGVAVSRDGKLIASGDDSGELIAWDRDGEPLTKPIRVHSKQIWSLDFSSDGTVLASGSWNAITEFWNTKTWQSERDPINCCSSVLCVRYSPSDEHLAIATTSNIQIWKPGTMNCIATFQAQPTFNGNWNVSLAWTLDGTRLLSAGIDHYPTIREWDSSTWKQVGEPWKGHDDYIHTIVINPTGTLVASASDDKHVRLWRLSDRRTIATFNPSYNTYCVAFPGMDSKHILSGGKNSDISEWAIPEDALSELASKAQATDNINDQQSEYEILTISMAARDACITGDLSAADKLLTQEIDTDGSNHNSYANRSFVMARKLDWDRALHDALKSVSIQPSFMGFIAKGNALCGTMQFQGAMKAFDIASTFVDADSSKIHLLLLIKAIALFNANQHDEAISRVQELAANCPNTNTLACSIVEAYLHIQNGLALDDVRLSEAVNHFTAAVNVISFSSTLAIHSKYDVFVVLFGWNLKSLWRTAHQNRCRVLFQAGRLPEALESYRFMMERSDDVTKASCLEWSTAFKQDYSALCASKGVVDFATSGDAALAAGEYDKAIEQYSAAIDMDFATDAVFANRSKASLEKMLWDNALLDAEKVIELNRSSDLGYQLKHAALHGARRYDEALEIFQVMLSMSDAPDSQLRELRWEYVSPSAREYAIQKAIEAQLENAPHRLFNTFTGRLYKQAEQINAFRTSTEYKELVSSTMKRADLHMGHIQHVVATYFGYVMLSHRWEGKEMLLDDIQGKDVFKLEPVEGIAKLQSFCRTARDAGHRWAWIDTCCIDQCNNAELQQSVNSMFTWYHHSALTIVYLSDVPPSSKSGSLARSAWITRGWTVQEFLAPKIVLFYQKDWSLYLNEGFRNHKESRTIMQELAHATGIDSQALVTFRPGMRGAREKLQWVSTRVTTRQEDIAYSLFGIFGVNLPVIYGEKKQSALGRLLQEIVARSGDITALDWVGQSSGFNSCLPADISSYKAPPCPLPSLQTSVSSLQHDISVESALKLYTLLDNMNAPRFAYCRLHLPCITFRVTAVRRQEMNSTYEVKADKLQDLQITTEDKLIQFSSLQPNMPTFLLVRPWNRLLELPDFADLSSLAELPFATSDTQSDGDYWSVPSSPLQESHESVDSELSDRALQLTVRLGQPFSAFLLAQQRGGEYKRIASDHHIIAQVKDISSIPDTTEARTLEIL